LLLLRPTLLRLRGGSVAVFLRTSPRADRADRRTPGGALARVVVRDLADDRARHRATRGAAGAGPLLAGFRLLDLPLRLLLLLRLLLAERERVAAGVHRRPRVAIGFVLRLLVGGLASLRKRVDVHRRRERLPGRRLRLRVRTACAEQAPNDHPSCRSHESLPA